MTSKPMISCSNSPFLIFLTINEVGPILAIRCVRIAFMIRRNGHTERRSDRRTDTPSYEDATAHLKSCTFTLHCFSHSPRLFVETHIERRGTRDIFYGWILDESQINQTRAIKMEILGFYSASNEWRRNEGQRKITVISWSSSWQLSVSYFIQISVRAQKALILFILWI